MAKVQIAQNDPALLSQLKFGGKSFDSKNLYVAQGMPIHANKEIIDAFNKNLAEIKANGEYAKIMEGNAVKDVMK